MSAVAIVVIVLLLSSVLKDEYQAEFVLNVHTFDHN